MEKEWLYKLSSYDYPLPKELIAQEALPQRDKARLLILNRHTGKIVHSEFRHIVNYLGSNDVLVINDTKVIPARLFGKKETGGKVEVLLLDFNPLEGEKKVVITGALLKASRPPRPGQVIYFEDGLKAEVLDYKEGKAKLCFYAKRSFRETLFNIGHMPLPPYIKREDKPEDQNINCLEAKRCRDSPGYPPCGLWDFYSC